MRDQQNNDYMRVRGETAHCVCGLRPLRDQPNNDYTRVRGETAYCVCDLCPLRDQQNNDYMRVGGEHMIRVACDPLRNQQSTVTT